VKYRVTGERTFRCFLVKIPPVCDALELFKALRDHFLAFYFGHFR